MWADIKGYEELYKISDSGEIWSKDRLCVDSKGRKRFREGQKLNPDIAPNGYYRVTLAKDGKKKQFYLHRLLALHFIPNPCGKPQVNHKDGNKVNCDLSNLEWVTVSENVIHAYEHGLVNHVCGEKHFAFGKYGSDSKRAKRVKATNIKTKEVKIYGAMAEAKKDGFSVSEISRCCNHGGTTRGFVFEFI